MGVDFFNRVFNGNTNAGYQFLDRGWLDSVEIPAHWLRMRLRRFRWQEAL